MKFVPNYTVSYHGEFHKAGIPFDIEDKDAEEMSAHGVVSVENTTEDIPAEDVIGQVEDIPANDEAEEEVKESKQTEENKPKRGRSKKTEDANDAD